MNDMSASAVPDLKVMQTLEKKITSLFDREGFGEISPAIIQPADVYLQQIGEAVRGRTYVFTDIDGEELCLRPDLTVPAARVFLEQAEQFGEKARIFYAGPGFRYPHDGPAHGNAREFRQAGIEIFGKEEAEKAEAEVLALTVKALDEVGATGYTIRLGDLGLFDALLNAIDMPARWRQRLSENFWRHEEFPTILAGLGDPENLEYEADLKTLLRAIGGQSADKAEDEVAAYLADKSIPLIGPRSLTEITAHLLEKAADLSAEPLSEDIIALIERYLKISAPPKAVGARLNDLAENAGLDLTHALDRYQKRMEWLGKLDVDLSKAEFTAEFGRNLEYYTGFVFQVEKPDMDQAGHIAGGGRYDHLLASLGAGKTLPAIGAAIHLDRLAALIDGDTL